MDAIENVKETIEESGSSNWYCLKLIQQSTTKDFSIIKQWRKLLNSSKNRAFMHRYIDGGVWIRFKSSDSEILLVFFTSTKDKLEETGFKKHIVIRYYSGCKMKPVIEISTIKATDGKTVHQIAEELINAEIDKTIELNIPEIKSSRFGTLFNANKNYKK